MASRIAFAASAALVVRSVIAQQPGSIPEVHPALTTYKCTTDGGCVAQESSLVIDWGNHKLETLNGSSCPVGNTSAVCFDNISCSENCVVQGFDYEAGGVTTDGDVMTLQQYIPTGNGTYNRASPRVYLLDPNGEDYESVKLTNQELSFDVDLSTLPCGMNGALYLSEMDMSGGRSEYNPGAAYGGGYCDAQCFDTSSWFNGTVNTNALGACCNEMDIWESNSEATGFTPHPCSIESIYGCLGEECAFTGVCDEWGCGFNPYALGQPKYYGRGPEFAIDTTKKFTVTTQFITDDNTASGSLIDVRRSYRQGNKTIENAVATAASGYGGLDSVTDEYCDVKSAEGLRLGGLDAQGRALERGSVLIFSIWNSDGDFMNWMDSGDAGPCNATEGDPALILANQPDTNVKFSNIRWGDIDSTTP